MAPLRRLVRGRDNFERTKLNEEVKNLEEDWKIRGSFDERKNRARKEHKARRQQIVSTIKKSRQINGVENKALSSTKEQVEEKIVSPAKSKKRAAPGEDLDQSGSKKMKIFKDVESQGTIKTKTAPSNANALKPKNIQPVSKVPETQKKGVREMAQPEDLLDENGRYKGTAGLKSIIKRDQPLKRKRDEDIDQERTKRSKPSEGQTQSTSRGSTPSTKRKSPVSKKGAKAPVPKSSIQNTAASCSMKQSSKKNTKAVPKDSTKIKPSVSNKTSTKQGSVPPCALGEPSKLGNCKEIPLEPEEAKPSKKRKASDKNDSRAAKRSETVRPASLLNRNFACYINSSIHTISSLTKLVNQLPKCTGNLLADADINEKDVVALRKTRASVAARKRIEQALRTSHSKGDINFTKCLAEVLEKIDAGGEEVNHQIFLSMSGIIFKTPEGASMDGESQEDAHEYLSMAIRKLEEENPDANLGRLFAMTLDTRMKCAHCGAFKTLHDTDLSVSFPTSEESCGVGEASFNEILQQALEDRSKFDEYECSSCHHKGGWDRPEGWDRKRLSMAPTYLQIPVARQGIDNNGALRKVNTPLKLTTRQIELPLCDGTTIGYELIATINHRSESNGSGHYYAIRKIGEDWFDCDDQRYGDGVESMTPEYFEQDMRAKNASVLIFQKAE